MENSLSTNKQGQALGKKGQATRERLLAAADRLLQQCSPLDLTAVAIAKEAQSSSATFYMYFDDVKDALFTLSRRAGNEVVAAMEALSADLVRANADFQESASELVRVFNDVWNRYRHILIFRNLEADRGDKNFEELRMEEYMRELHVLSSWINCACEGHAGASKGDAFALASVLHAALERIASLDPEIVTNGIGQERMAAAQARIIAQVLSDTPRWGLLPLASKQQQ